MNTKKFYLEEDEEFLVKLFNSLKVGTDVKIEHFRAVVYVFALPDALHVKVKEPIKALGYDGKYDGEVYRFESGSDVVQLLKNLLVNIFFLEFIYPYRIG